MIDTRGRGDGDRAASHPLLCNRSSQPSNQRHAPSRRDRQAGCGVCLGWATSGPIAGRVWSCAYDALRGDFTGWGCRCTTHAKQTAWWACTPHVSRIQRPLAQVRATHASAVQTAPYHAPGYHAPDLGPGS
jgi:hypothetical protein